MKIAFAHKYDPAFQLGGAARFVLDLASYLKSETPHEICVLTHDGPFADALRGRRIPVEGIPRSRLSPASILAKTSRVLRAFQPDVIHSHHR